MLLPNCLFHMGATTIHQWGLWNKQELSTTAAARPILAWETTWPYSSMGNNMARLALEI